MIMKLYEYELTCDNQVVLAQVIMKHKEHEFTWDEVILAQVIMKLYEHEFTCDKIDTCSIDNYASFNINALVTDRFN